MVMDGASSGRVEIGFKGVIGSTIAKIDIKNKIITPAILYYYLKTKEIEIQENTTGTSIPHADRKRIEQFEIAIPNNDLFSKYSKLAGLILDKINNNKREVRTLAQIRDALLPKLMSGEITISP
jgi:type I restriction enzyme S subunit